MFEMNPNLRQEFTRLHQLISQYIEDQNKIQKLDEDEEQ